MMMTGAPRSEPPRAARRTVARATAAALIVLAAATTACHGLLDPPLPAGTQDPSSFHNEAGALARYHDAVDDAAGRLVDYAVDAGLLTDELRDNTLGGGAGAVNQLDERLLPEVGAGSNEQSGGSSDYQVLQGLRGSTADAIGALRTYAPRQPTALVGEMYAYQGYAEVELADMFCSGIPLSTLDYGGDFTYRAGSTTADVYRHAIALFDTALTLAGDSARVANLALVGKGRALLDLGEYADAAQTVSGVPDDFRFWFSIDWRGRPQDNGLRQPPPLQGTTVSDVEGGNGIDFISSGDPRSASHRTGVNTHGVAIFAPDAYTDVAPFTIASGVEARLIQAEAALQAGDVTTWLATLNHLRETAIVPALADTTDPGTPDARVDLTFRERALWLFLTGHRQGDLRRLVRQYGRRQEQVYPTGFYPGGQGVYGTDVTAPIPPGERVNPLFTGCFDRDP
ncbi:MAG TPA: RagB/SusD family nutrient uptake outer membrane protein [Gemmatimonadaceae bacterium]|nr:RagB/SusD family nutrient uptake outer membrane protein [Gemmatimonadaceae bacterium]